MSLAASGCDCDVLAVVHHIVLGFNVYELQLHCHGIMAQPRYHAIGMTTMVMRTNGHDKNFYNIDCCKRY